MKLSYIFFLSVSNLKKRKLRSVITIGGMAVGIALIIFLVSLGFGLQRLIREHITNVDALTILDITKGESSLLKLDDATIEKLNNLENVKEVSPSLTLSGQISFSGAVTDVGVYGVDPGFLSLEGITLNYGRSFASSESAEVIITDIAMNLIGFSGPEEAIGQEINLKILVPNLVAGVQEAELIAKIVPVTIVGVTVDSDELSISYIPLKYMETMGVMLDYSAVKVRVADEATKEYSLARVKVSESAKLPEVRRQIEEMGFQVDSLADTVGQIDKIFVMFEIIVAGFGAIAMFIAALGAFNTLTVSLLERTREIGLMKSLGVKSRDIYRLFLVESVLIGVVGGVLGIAGGIAIAEIANNILNIIARKVGAQTVDIFYYPIFFLLAVLGGVFLLNLVTGLYPARRAAKINALDALRYE